MCHETVRNYRYITYVRRLAYTYLHVGSVKLNRIKRLHVRTYLLMCPPSRLLLLSWTVVKSTTTTTMAFHVDIL